MEKTEKQEKLAFITKGKRILVERLAEQLKSKANIDARVTDGYYGHGIYVNIDDYKEAITTGSNIAWNDDRYEISWVDADNVPHPVGYIPIMYGVLPQTQKGNILWESYNTKEFGTPDELIKYINYLGIFCGVSNVILNYNSGDNAFTILVTAPFAMHDLMVKRCRGFNYVNEYTPFIETYYPSYDNSIIIDSKSVLEKRFNDLKSYFYNSLFHDIIRYPQGANIAPHNDDYPRYMGSYGRTTFLSSNNFETMPENKLSINGEFEVVDKKGNEFHENKYCVVTDSGNFSSILSFSKNEVSMTTEVNVSRQIVGNNLDGQNDRDAFFTCLSGNGSEGKISCTEHFVKIANGTRLLHYSDEFDSFEVFNLPNNWFIENGLDRETTGYPKAFDDTEFDMGDKDLTEIYEILKSKKKNFVATKSLKK